MDALFMLYEKMICSISDNELIQLEGKIKRRHGEEEKWKKAINYAPTGSSSPGYYRAGSF